MNPFSPSLDFWTAVPDSSPFLAGVYSRYAAHPREDGRPVFLVGHSVADDVSHDAPVGYVDASEAPMKVKDVAMEMGGGWWFPGYGGYDPPRPEPWLETGEPVMWLWPNTVDETENFKAPKDLVAQGLQGKVPDGFQWKSFDDDQTSTLETAFGRGESVKSVELGDHTISLETPWHMTQFRTSHPHRRRPILRLPVHLALLTMTDHVRRQVDAVNTSVRARALVTTADRFGSAPPRSARPPTTRQD